MKFGWALVATGAAALAYVLIRVRQGAGILVVGPGNIPRGGRFGVPRKTHTHVGIDVFAPEGTPVRAAGAGTVEASGPITGYGETVVVDQADGVRSLYAHLSVRSVRAGETIRHGQLVGRVGRTAYGDCGRYFCHSPPHLHYEVITNARPINRFRSRIEPVAYLATKGVRVHA